MRHSNLLLVTLALSSAAGVWACSSNTAVEDDIDISALTSQELALKALQIIGAKQDPAVPNYGVPGVVGNGACGTSGCHSISKRTLISWKETYDRTMGPNGTLRSTTLTKEQKIAALRRDPSNPRSEFGPRQLGIGAAGVHLGVGANVIQTKHPNTFEQGTLFADLFKGKTALYSQFQREMLMPVDTAHPRLTPTEYELVYTWISQGMPEADQYIPEPTTAMSCIESFTGLRAHVKAMKSSNWMQHNRDAQLLMFGCESPSTLAENCLQQKRGGADIFPLARTQPFGIGWEKEGSSTRILRTLTHRTSYWMRTSADGRFVSNGGGSYIDDLASALAGQPERVISVPGSSFDPEFFPDNKGFMWPGRICPQSILENPATTSVTMREPGCSGTTAGLYMSIGQVVGDNAIADRFIINSSTVSDSGNGGGDGRVTAGPDSQINIRPLTSNGNDVASGYTELGMVSLKAPFLGDAMTSRSGRLVSTRIANTSNKGGPGTLGYNLATLTPTKANGQYTFVMRDAGKVCVQGNKANLSFDERFISSQHYLADDSSEVWVTDFVTGETKVALKMNAGQNAKYPHFRSDGWLYSLVEDRNTSKIYVVATDYAIRAVKAVPTP